MKTLYLIRHAKSSWDEPGLSDFDRPLNDRGKKDGPAMAERLLSKDISIDHFISSPAKRARRTARFFAEAYGVKKDKIELVESLYMADPADFRSVISSIDDKHASAAIFSHNPGITEFANSLTSVRTDNMPTCSIFAVQAEVEHWSAFENAEKKFLFFDYPKNPIG